jgi:hypothetical protein
MMLFLSESRVIIRGESKAKSPYYVKPKANDFPITAVLLNVTRWRYVGGRLVEEEATTKRVINPFRIPFGEVGKSRHSPSSFRIKDARLHEPKFTVVNGDKVIVGVKTVHKKGCNDRVIPIKETVGGTVMRSVGKADMPDHEFACLLGPK